MERRDFLKTYIAAAATPAAASLLTSFAAEAVEADELLKKVTDLPRPKEQRKGEMLYRELGKTGEFVSAIGLGGHHIGIPPEEKDGIALIRGAIDAGITFMDNCWDYHNGESEVRMGKALMDGYRDKVFLMTKIDGRTKAAAALQIDECLQRLQTDHIDLMQHHEILRMEDPDRVFAPGGAHEAVIEAQKAGKIRFIGFTGHKDPLVHQRMLQVAEQHEFRFDTVQMPVNCLDAHFRSFTENIIPLLVEKSIGVLGMKPLASGNALRTGAVTAPECLRYALSMPTNVVITGIDKPEMLQQALQVVKEFHPMNGDEIKTLLAKTLEPASTGKYEPFKTSNLFDGTAKNPEWLG